ncbi:mitochondrial-processing peptidase subunit beta, putative [Plasmodium vivax]|uniref:Organelle processing peptidase, putative n=6 Tax=Plasmodium vivax TaxID=5855 RepID=A5KEA9_PLAVS|nr:organelle processing peptidase, putative [Plasmodium vivax]KMZ81170.1 organelle processing peptidase [Plasmodium vivax India VII]KMZ87290.1 organelle processing peptidase [Plasmodium vivax Brazil I]KMZ93670.1 organelle processing peptidase [Plasmodium vivax Mauritania I]KNA00269.1 organelle processing peptidase [Plasmodium vivax North Korean]EDL42327.1 organelle processing peptidase, putative [Plasmodium vivax]|eukprot:XP_001608351.1 organelle processing peptidase [Plasmodium vivax Sal-1]
MLGRALRRYGSLKGLPQEVLNQPGTRVSELPNKLKIATVKSSCEVPTIGIWVSSGSKYESKQNNGVAHFLEHMIFKGTKKRSRIQLEKEIENMGAHLNAYTAREQTSYYCRCFKGDVKWCIELLSDILSNSIFDEDLIEMEKHVILREMEEVEKSKDEVIFDKLHMTAFRDHALGYTILGPIENIKNMNRQSIINYIHTNYTSDRMVLCAVGDVEHEEIVKLAEQHFSHLKPQSSHTTSASNLDAVKPYFCGSEIIVRDDDSGPSAHVAVAFEGVDWKSPDSITFMLMQCIIGTYKKSEEGILPGKLSANRTVNNICNKMTVGCADYFSAFNTCYNNTGLFGFYVQCDELAVEHALGELMFGVTSLSYSITDEEVELAKIQLKTQLINMFESSSTLAEEVSRQILVYGRNIPLAEFLLRLDKIDTEEVKRVAWKYLHDREIAVAAMGALHGMPQYYDLRQKTFWLRY